MASTDFRLRYPLRVRWADVDKQGVVFNGHYLTYCDIGVTEYMRDIGLRYPEELLALGSDLYVRKATLDYHAGAQYDDELLICARTASLGRTSLRFLVDIVRAASPDDVLIQGELVYVNVDPATKKSSPWPLRLRELILGYERVAPEQH